MTSPCFLGRREARRAVCSSPLAKPLAGVMTLLPRCRHWSSDAFATALFSTRRFQSSKGAGGEDRGQDPPATEKPTSRGRMSLTIRSPSQRTRRGGSAYSTGVTANQVSSESATATSAPASRTAMPGRTSGEPLGRGERANGSVSAEVGGAAGSHGIEVMRSLSHFTEPVKRILLVRNGRSAANEDVGTYVSTPDWRIPLVEEGKWECVETGCRLAELVGDEPVYVYYSPYIRSRQSLRYVLQGYDEGRQAEPNRHEWWEADDGAETESAARNASSAKGHAANGHYSSAHDSSVLEAVDAKLQGRATTTTAPILTPHKLHDTSLVLRSGSNNRIIGVREDVRLRDGDIGRYRNTAELIHHFEERERYGKFFYRFPYGESGADVCDRVTSFLDAFQRERVEFPMNTNVVVITHGLTIRMFIKRWFHLTVDTFHKMQSPPSGSIVTLTRLHHRSCFRLDEACVEGMNLPLSLNEHNGYKYRNKRLLGSMSSGAPYM